MGVKLWGGTSVLRVVVLIRCTTVSANAWNGTAIFDSGIRSSTTMPPAPCRKIKLLFANFVERENWNLWQTVKSPKLNFGGVWNVYMQGENMLDISLLNWICAICANPIRWRCATRSDRNVLGVSLAGRTILCCQIRDFSIRQPNVRSPYVQIICVLLFVFDTSHLQFHLFSKLRSAACTALKCHKA